MLAEPDGLEERVNCINFLRFLTQEEIPMNDDEPI